MAFVSLDLPSCGVPCLILHSVVYRDVTRQAKGLYRLKHVGAHRSGLAYLSRCNSSWFCNKQLRGTARLWWDHYHAMQPADHVVTWDEFRTAFRAYHIPKGLIERKLNEFMNLTQGTRTVMQYAQVFDHLCQYAGYHADNDARK
jgi:hypothetical protein